MGEPDIHVGLGHIRQYRRGLARIHTQMLVVLVQSGDRVLPQGLILNLLLPQLLTQALLFDLLGVPPGILLIHIRKAEDNDQTNAAEEKTDGKPSQSISALGGCDPGTSSTEYQHHHQLNYQFSSVTYLLAKLISKVGYVNVIAGSSS